MQQQRSFQKRYLTRARVPLRLCVYAFVCACINWMNTDAQSQAYSYEARSFLERNLTQDEHV